MRTIRRRKGFTLIELLMVAFIIAIMLTLLAPAVMKYRSFAMRKKTESHIQTIRLALSSYRDSFGRFPPSEPDLAQTTSYDVYYGSKALLYFLNGFDGKGYTVGSTTYPPRVTGVPITASAAFQDAWGNPIEYFLAYRNRPKWQVVDGSGNLTWPRDGKNGRLGPGECVGDVFPRACNVDVESGSRDYYFDITVGSGGKVRVGGVGIRVPVARWLSGWPIYYCATHTDKTTSTLNEPCPTCGKPIYAIKAGWQYNAIANAGTQVLLVSQGADGLWGSVDDVGDVGDW